MIVFLVPIVELGWSFGLVFVSCELAGRLSIEFDDIDYMIGQFKWYLFPFEVQKMLPILIINVQQEVAFEFFGSAMCNRETFKNVIRKKRNIFVVVELFTNFHNVFAIRWLPLHTIILWYCVIFNTNHYNTYIKSKHTTIWRRNRKNQTNYISLFS